MLCQVGFYGHLRSTNLQFRYPRPRLQRADFPGCNSIESETLCYLTCVRLKLSNLLHLSYKRNYLYRGSYLKYCLCFCSVLGH